MTAVIRLGADGCFEEVDVTGSGEDVQSGRYFVPSGLQYIIALYFQSIVKGGLDLEGDLIVDGQLFMEV